MDHLPYQQVVSQHVDCTWNTEWALYKQSNMHGSCRTTMRHNVCHVALLIMTRKLHMGHGMGTTYKSKMHGSHGITKRHVIHQCTSFCVTHYDTQTAHGHESCPIFKKSRPSDRNGRYNGRRAQTSNRTCDIEWALRKHMVCTSLVPYSITHVPQIEMGDIMGSGRTLHTAHGT